MTDHYAIRGGQAGKQRLNILADVLEPSTNQSFDTLGVTGPLRCLDIGCGGGHVSIALAQRLLPQGTVLAVDIDDSLLDLARQDPALKLLENLQFHQADARTFSSDQPFDMLYSRFLLTHLPQPEQVLSNFQNLLHPGGRIILEEIDFTGHFTEPALPAFERYCTLYSAVVSNRGGDVNLGRKLPGLLHTLGFQDIGVHIVQPAGLTGNAKRLNEITLQNIAPSLRADGFASADEIEQLLHELRTFADEPNTLVGLPRIVQTWAHKPLG